MNQLMVSAKSESSIDPVPAGLHLAVCVTIYDIGTHHNEKWDSYQRKVILAWELPELPPLEFERDGAPVSMPRCVSRRFTLSLSDKAHLRHVLESWRGVKFTENELSGFNLAAVLGAPCQVQIMHEPKREGGVYATVSNVLPAPKKSKVDAKTERRLFSVSSLKWRALPEWLPDWAKKLVQQSKEWEKLARGIDPADVPPPSFGAAPAADDVDDDIPF